ncbi:MAG: hypothetical protein K2P93_01170 [Alphaproteobacteria bacterium]|nr:hypothetical protein [Alphaproteobacteria bacterium]
MGPLKLLSIGMVGIGIFLFEGLNANSSSCVSPESIQSSFESDELSLHFNDQSPSIPGLNLGNKNVLTQTKAQCTNSLSFNERDFQSQPSQTKPNKKPSERKPHHPKLLKVSP